MEPAPLIMTQKVSTEEICSMCHQPILPTYYFCPNCGNNLASPPLPTTVFAQTKLYLHSVVLPSICFITIGRWKGIQYVQASDQKTKTIGLIACVLIALSTLFTFWLVVSTTQKIVNTSIQSINTELLGY
jgi:hypothetical protein